MGNALSVGKKESRLVKKPYQQNVFINHIYIYIYIYIYKQFLTLNNL